MAYRQTTRVRARLEATRERIFGATVQLVADGGWSAVTMHGVAGAAGVAVGTIYRHAGSRDELVVEVFRRAASRELDRFREAAQGPSPALERVERCLRTFAERAMRRRRLAYALLAEPAGSAIEQERLAYRLGYRTALEDVLTQAAVAGEVAAHDAPLVAAVVTGAMGEALIGPLAPVGDRTGRPASAQVDEVVAACLRALPPSYSAPRSR